MQTYSQLLSGQYKGAHRLKLSCGLREFPREIFDLADTLEILDLSGNYLSKLPEDFGRLKKLRIVFFSDNDFTELPKVLSQCTNLDIIGLKANKISHIPEDTFPINLRWLILTNNQITHIPKSIGKCPLLQKLMLAGNRLTSLPVGMAACQNLELLRISANQIHELPDWLFSLPRLSWLAFGGNPSAAFTISNKQLAEIPWNELLIEEQLGEGASGIIAKAQWQDKNTRNTSMAAVKVFKGEVTSDGLPADEMRACIVAGTHPNLIKVLGKISEHPTQKQGLVLELIPVDFKNLGNPPSFETCTRDTYKQDTFFSIKAIISIALGMAEVTAHLHNCGIMHGDLYAHNILIDKKANALLSDFGAASIYNRGDSERAALIERLEVRAFGCLLEELLEHFDNKDANHNAIEALTTLKEACMKSEVQIRPDFTAICQYITSLQ